MVRWCAGIGEVVVLLLTLMVGACDEAPEESISVSARGLGSDAGGTGGCRSRGPSPVPTKDLGGTARGDFDGDGRHDTVTIYDPVGPPQPRVRIEFGAGGMTDEELPDGGTVGSVIDTPQTVVDPRRAAPVVAFQRSQSKGSRRIVCRQGRRGISSGGRRHPRR
jgi:hypothetical protein